MFDEMRKGGIEGWSQAEAAGAEQREDGGRNRVKDDGKLSCCLLLQTLNRLEGVQC